MTSAEAVESADDLLIEILSKLPLRSLARCKFVSRRWHSIVDSWVSLNPTPSAVGLFLPSGLHAFMYLPFDPKTQKDSPFGVYTLQFHNEDSSRPIRIHQSCNGLLLCCSPCEVDQPHFGSPIRCCYVYNPTSKDFARLPMPVVSPQTRIVTVNLAFDPSKSPFYKAVCLRASHLCPSLLHAEIYSVESNAWRSSGEPFTVANNTVGLLRHGVYWNGSVHWIDYWAYEILYLNVDDGRLRRIRLPAALNNLKRDAIREGYFGESCGRLHVIPMTPNGSLSVYEMKEDYSDWLVKYEVLTTKVCPGISRFKSVLTLTHHEDGCSFLVMLMSDRVVRYDLVTTTYRTIFRIRNQFEFNLISAYGLHGWQYIESAALVI